MKYSFSDTQKNKREFLLLLALLIVYFLLGFVGLEAKLKTAVYKLWQPVNQFNSQLVFFVAQPFLDLKKSFKAARKVQDLERKYAEASAALGEMENLREENQALRQIIESSDRTLSTSVVSIPILSFAQAAVAAGHENGVQTGDTVLFSNTLLGLIEKVDTNQSTVCLLSHRGCAAILAETEKGAQGIIRGNGRRLTLTEIPIEEELEINERVVSLGQQGISKGLFIGRVIEIISKPELSAKTAILEQYVSFYETPVVEIR